MKRTRVLAAALLLSLALVAQPAAPSSAAKESFSAASGPATKDRGLFLNILPAGQGTSTTSEDALRYEATGERPEHDMDQYRMYSKLRLHASDLTGADLTKFYKSESFVLPQTQVERTEHPRDGVTVLRDRFGVPHIYGQTRYATMFAAGYVTAEDRLFLADVLRHVGKGRLSEFLGPSEANLAMDRDYYLAAGYSQKERRDQLLRVLNLGPAGARAVADGKAFIAGINARIHEDMEDPSKMPAEYAALQIQPTEWRPTDVVAVATLIQAFFASGGGGELQNAVFLRKAQEKLGGERGRLLWRDLREMEDPETTTTLERQFPYMRRGTINRAAVAVPALGSVRHFDPIKEEPPAGSSSTSTGTSVSEETVSLNPIADMRLRLRQAFGIAFPDGASNWLAVTRGHTAAGHPIAVMGPQVGYWSPEILMEIDMHGPGINARGATFPGISLYVLLGRGEDFAWSATSGESDLIDVRAERLCTTDGTKPTIRSRHYVFHGSCIPMERRTDEWTAKPTAATPNDPPRQVTAKMLRTIHGPVIAFGRVAGHPVAFTQQRSTWFGELDSAVPFVYLNGARINGVQVDSAKDYIDVMSRKFTGSFNWLYVDDRDVGYIHTGKYPVRAPGVDPDLPSWGTGQWEWRGFVAPRSHPHAINPAKGWIASWNNKPAPAWRVADANWGYSTTHRVEMLSDRLARRIPHGGVRPSDMVRIMADAATVDLRGQEVLPWLLRAVGNPGGSQQQYVNLLRAWVAAGAHRLDANGDGKYDQAAAVALMDAWWPRLIRTSFASTMSGLFDAMPIPFDDAPSTKVGSSYLNAFYGQVEKAVRQAVGAHVAQRYRVLRCGTGTLASCRAALRSSLAAAVKALGSPNPASWDAREARDKIDFAAVGLIDVPDMPWQNRPTFQQVVQVFTHRPR